jgi:hypothetical protein
MNIRIGGACALAALLLLPACGSDPAADAADAQARNEARIMANAADGSAAKAVGDMMSDPTIRDQLGIGSSPAATQTPSGAPMTPVDPSPSVDPSQVRALALCHGLDAARRGTPYPMGDEADARAAAELRADPAALAKCQNG